LEVGKKLHIPSPGGIRAHRIDVFVSVATGIDSDIVSELLPSPGARKLNSQVSGEFGGRLRLVTIIRPIRIHQVSTPSAKTELGEITIAPGA
jgi:hypothetical protein